jgi:GxxExxY protein
MKENDITNLIIGAAIQVHSALGPGLLESAYTACLFNELEELGLKVKKEYPLPLQYKKTTLDVGYRIDLLVEDKIVVELKSVEELNDLHLAQMITYLKLANCEIGLLINFNVLKLKDGIKRVANNYKK